MLLHLGAFVFIPGHNNGVAKIVSLDATSACIEWFTSIARHKEKPLQQQVPLRRLKLAGPPLQTRCYVEMPDGTWGIGRITREIAPSACGDGRIVWVKIGGEAEEYYPEARVWVRLFVSPGSKIAARVTVYQGARISKRHR
jgi:hypothetical protein